MIKTEKLTKKFGGFEAVKGVDLEVQPGEIFGFLGPNGAGKTTTIRMLIGLLKPTSGKVFIGGYDLEKNPISAKSLVGFIPDRPYIYEKLTAREFLNFVGGIYGMSEAEIDKRAPALLEFFDLKTWADELAESFSHGMKQRLVYAAALLHEPKVVIVDEPMVGMDPKGAKLLKDAFRNFAHKEGKTIFMSTHTLEVAEEVCDRIAIIMHGLIIAQGTMAELRNQARSKDANLEDIFLKLTGGEEVKDLIQGLRG
jgi:ABC-2 type transport system ATP-binding protein